MVGVVVVAAVEGAVVERREAFNEPFFLQWHLTDQCNLACQHCYRDGRKEDLDIDALESILAMYVAFLERIGRAGRIQFTGGEPLLSPFIYHLIRLAKSHHIPSRVLTNGTLITTEIACKLRKAGCRLVQVSLEGLRELHEIIRGPNTFQRALDGVAALRVADIEVTISMTVSRINVEEVRGVIRLAEGIADRVSFHRLVPWGRGRQFIEQIFTPLEVQELMKLLDFERQRTNIELPLRDPLWKAYFKPRLEGCNAIAGCAVGYNGLTIDSNGDVYPCRRLPIVVGNVLERPLWEIWDDPMMQELRDRDRLGGKCGGCHLRWVCGGCRGIAYAIKGDPMGADPQCFRELSWLERVRKSFIRMAYSEEGDRILV